MNPEEYGIKLADSEDLNSAAALYAAEIVNSLDEGIKKAQELIDSGRAYKKYEELTAC